MGPVQVASLWALQVAHGLALSLQKAVVEDAAVLPSVCRVLLLLRRLGRRLSGACGLLGSYRLACFLRMCEVRPIGERSMRFSRKVPFWLAALLMAAADVIAFSPIKLKPAWQLAVLPSHPCNVRSIVALEGRAGQGKQHGTFSLAHLLNQPVAFRSTRHSVAVQAATERLPLASGGIKTLESEKTTDPKRELGSDLLQRLEQMEGIWYSDDFYGPHGREWVDVSATLVGAGTSALVAIKVSGDANVPSGCVTWQTRGLPDVGGCSVPAEVQIRADPTDPNGFSWLPASLVLVSENTIDLTVVWPGSGALTGSFHKHNVGEGA